MTTISDAAAALAAALGVTKELIGINKLMTEAEFKLKIADLTTALAKAQMAVADVQSDLSEKDKQISDLKAAFTFKDALIEVQDFKYRAQNGRPIGAAFCPRCEVVDGRFIRLAESSKAGVGYICPQCKSDYGYRPTVYSDPEARSF